MFILPIQNQRQIKQTLVTSKCASTRSKAQDVIHIILVAVTLFLSTLVPVDARAGGSMDIAVGPWAGDPAIGEARLVSAVTGTGETGLLTASHIRPWHRSNNIQRLDENNGLLLSAAYDRAFNDGFLTFSDSGLIVPSEAIDPADLQRSGVQLFARLREYDGQIDEYMSFHRENVFKT